MRQTVPAALTTPMMQVLAAVRASRSSSTSRCRNRSPARTTVGEFVSFMTAMLMLLAPLKHLTEVNAPLQRGLAAAESVFALIDTPVEEDERHGGARRARAARSRSRA